MRPVSPACRRFIFGGPGSGRAHYPIFIVIDIIMIPPEAPKLKLNRGFLYGKMKPADRRMPGCGRGDRNMKRSEINRALKELEAMCEKHCFALPPFCHFSPEDWQTKGHEYDEIRDCMLGWDITDYGTGKFDEVGFSLITLRNGNRKDPARYPKVYAEKLLYLKEGQYSPMHFHWFKTEDIINRGGGNVLIRVYNALPDESIDFSSDVTVHTDGRTYTVPAGTQIRLTPGESISITQYLYHDFNVEPGSGAVLLGEVSQCNDDNTDNRFAEPVGRFPEIEEDEAPYRLLCFEYPEAKD